MNELHTRETSDSAENYADAMGVAQKDTSLLKRADDGARLRLHGVDHTARPTWRLRETVVFYRDVLKLPLVHCISARGWGPPGHHDFLHFFFDSGEGSTIAFFYYLGSDMPEKYQPEMHHFYAATHTAWRVETEGELKNWKTVLENRGVVVSPYTRHEVLESIYFVDPNGYPVEITRRLRDIARLDAEDAQLTLQAAIDVEAAAEADGRRVDQIDEIWRRKAELVEAGMGKGGL